MRTTWSSCSTATSTRWPTQPSSGGADPDAAWAEALRRANAFWERLDRDLPVTCAECAWMRQARAADGTVVRVCADTWLEVRSDDYCSRGYKRGHE